MCFGIWESSLLHSGSTKLYFILWKWGWKKEEKSINLSIFGLLSLLKALFSNGPGIQLPWATEILFPAMQQVRALSSIPPLSCAELQVISFFFFPPSALLFIGHLSVKVNSMKEGMRGKKPIRRERWDEVWWTGLPREGGDDANQICTPYKKSTDEMALLLWQHTFCSGILGVTLIQVLQDLNRVWSQTTWHRLVWNVRFFFCFPPLRLPHINMLFLAPVYHFGSKILVFRVAAVTLQTLSFLQTKSWTICPVKVPSLFVYWLDFRFKLALLWRFDCKRDKDNEEWVPIKQICSSCSRFTAVRDVIRLSFFHLAVWQHYE